MMLGLLTLTKNAYYDIPDRMIDGYGLSERLINRCKEEKINLLITVDCGIAEHELVKKAIDEGKIAVGRKKKKNEKKLKQKEKEEKKMNKKINKLKKK